MRVKQLHLSAKNKVDQPIIEGLNDVAPVMQRNVHDAARFLLRKAIDDFVEQNGIELHKNPDEDESSSQRRAG